MTKALIVTGELRFKDRAHFEHFKSFFADYDIYISTYESYEKLAAELTSSYLLHPRNIEENLRFKKREVIGGDLEPLLSRALNRTVASARSTLQWFHLDQVLKNYESQLLKYDVVVKTRSDLASANLPQKSWEECLEKVDKDTLYTRSDYLFYAQSSHFINALKDFYPQIKTYYLGKTFQYIPLNYDNILNSGDDCTADNVRFTWLILPDILVEGRKDHKRNRIWQGDFFTFKRLIKQHYDFLADLNSLEHPAALPLGCFRNFPPNRQFSSEQVFCIHSINAGLVKNSLISVDLRKDRYRCKYIL